MYTLNDYYRESGVQLDVPFAQYCEMKFSPREDQVVALNQSLVKARYGNYSEPGVGKTVAAQAYAAYWIAEGNRVLVTMPPALLYQFEESFKDTFKGIDRYISFHILDEAPKKRAKLLETWHREGFPQVLLMSYRMFSRTYKDYAVDYDVLISDEAHSLKNSGTKLHKQVKEFLGAWGDKAFLAMTGTPIPNELVDAYGLVSLTNPEAYRTFKYFEAKHCVYKTIRLRQPKRTKSGRMIYQVKVLDRYVNVEDVNQHLYKNGMRVLKRDVLEIEKPTIIEVPVHLDRAHKKLYDTLVRERMLEVGDEVITALQEQGLRQKMLQIVTCPHFFVAPEVEIKNEILNTADTILDGIGLSRTKVVIFANYQQTVESLAERYEKHNPAVVYGKSKSAEEQRKKFIGDDTCRLLIANPISAGVGLDGLQHVSHHMIFVEPTGVPGTFRQAVDRLVRNGQKEPVVVYVLKALKTLAPKATEEMRRKEGTIRTIYADRESLLDYFRTDAA